MSQKKEGEEEEDNKEEEQKKFGKIHFVRKNFSLDYFHCSILLLKLN